MSPTTTTFARARAGRQRRYLIKQRERAVVRQNLEGMQAKRLRGREETRWGRNEQEYEQEWEHYAKLYDIDRAKWGKPGAKWEEQMQAMGAMGAAASESGTRALAETKGMLQAAGALDAGKISGLKDLFEAMGKVGPGTVKLLADLFRDVD